MARWLPKGLEGKARSSRLTAPALFRTSPNPYLSVWDPDRAVREALTRVTWVFRCVDAISGNAAKIPFLMRRNDSKNGPPIPNHPLNFIFNSRANVGEDSFTFRYRLSSQLLLSSKGVFIEVVKNKAGEPIAMVLLPPQYTRPIPDTKNFVAGYEVYSTTVSGPGGPNKVVLPPDRVIWIRRPHPIDPYGSMTPLEAAGLAIESDWLARIYNRNFMLNDGRPGGLIVIKGVVSEEDKDELRARYRGNVNTAGRIGVLSSDEGADFVDTAVHPRDMQYNELRTGTRDEINVAFGVGLSVMGDAGSKTFENAEMERLVFWMETMTTHLEIIARPLDMMDEDPKNMASFDISGVDVLQRAEIKRTDFLLKEFNQGVRTANEYRPEVNLPKLAEGGDTVYMSNLYTPAGSTKKGGIKEIMKTVDDATPIPPAPPAAPVPPGRPERPPMDQNKPDPETPQADKPRTPGRQRNQRPVREAASAENDEMLQKQRDQWKTQMLSSYDRWELIYERSLQRLFEREERVILEKLNGQKTAKRWAVQADITDLIFDRKVYDAQAAEDLVPVWSGTVQEFATALSPGMELNEEAYTDAKELQATSAKSVNDYVEKAIQFCLEEAADAGEGVKCISEKLTDQFSSLKTDYAHAFAHKAINQAAELGMKLAKKDGEWIQLNGSERKALYITPVQAE